MQTQNRQRKSIAYSQNFLRGRGLVAELIHKSSITQDDIVYEIGSGEGIITQELAKQCKQVISTEIDQELHSKLLHKFTGFDNVQIILGDFLTYGLPNNSYKVFSNIPFNITSQVVRKLTQAQIPPLDAYLIMQLEAAQKFGGSSCDTRETQFSILIKPWFELEIVHKFKRTDFYPVPSVDTVLLRLRKRDKSLVQQTDKQLYEDFIVYAFSQWKPTLREGLRLVFTNNQYARLATNFKLPNNAVPTQLDFNQWLGLFSYFSQSVDDTRKQVVAGSAIKQEQEQAKLQKINRTRKDRNWKSKA